MQINIHITPLCWQIICSACLNIESPAFKKRSMKNLQKLDLICTESHRKHEISCHR